MSATTNDTYTCRIDDDRTLAVAAKAGDRLRVVRGRVWISAEDIASDRIVEAREELALRGGELVVIQALGPAIVRLTRAARRAHGHRAAALGAIGMLQDAGRSLRALRERLQLGPRTQVTIAP
ncbi:MAG TPA: DUF2917 domain-containing protein [Burkholderiaceae bacterium]|nr:DUF2917 domain-containing protein [Burkholderiaceae bacterium]